ncbi:hypothetical protein [Citrobacter sp. FDAARGOS_156]|uniref:hypothetical protein n=1 Tax=Citrobacter sp. FDAARGOS_156 TaxID=1702170 RepID=UPI00190271E6|nr:hypothetical protein [Citrobacter sp. FDAARGOS_156]MBJ8926094.1 hypothetical protein [Citrobacter sp. FDAARGOS_156]
MAATKSEQFEYNENPASAGFLLSGDTTGVFANVLRHSTPVISSISKVISASTFSPVFIRTFPDTKLGSLRTLIAAVAFDLKPREGMVNGKVIVIIHFIFTSGWMFRDTGEAGTGM